MSATRNLTDREVRAFQARHGALGGREKRTAPLADVEIRASGAADADFTVKGYASVFGKESLSMGWFTEFVDPGAFDRVLGESPDTFLNINHDMNYVLARTRSGTLELKTDTRGLRFWARPAATSYAEDLHILMDRGDVDQASFCFTVREDRWEERPDGALVRTILEVGQLYDVCITGSGAYPDSSSEVVRSYVRDYARGRSTSLALAKSKARAKRLRHGIGRAAAVTAPARDPLTLPRGQRRFDRRGVLAAMRTLGVRDPVTVTVAKLGRDKAGFYRRAKDGSHEVWLQMGLPADEAARTLVHELTHAAQVEQHGDRWYDVYHADEERYEAEAELAAERLHARVKSVA